MDYSFGVGDMIAEVLQLNPLFFCQGQYTPGSYLGFSIGGDLGWIVFCTLTAFSSRLAYLHVEVMTWGVIDLFRSDLDPVIRGGLCDMVCLSGLISILIFEVSELRFKLATGSYFSVANLADSFGFALLAVAFIQRLHLYGVDEAYDDGAGYAPESVVSSGCHAAPTQRNQTQ